MATQPIDEVFLTKPPQYDPTSRRYPMVPKPPVQVGAPAPAPAVTCACDQSGTQSGFEQKIKENPVLFIIGALALGYFLAKK